MRLPFSCLLTASLLLSAANAQPQAPFEQVLVGPQVTDALPSFGATFADIDGDGDPDLFVANNSGVSGNDLYRNDGVGGFTSIVDPVSTGTGFGWHGSFADVDSDGDLDLFVSKRSGANNQYYQNQGGAQAGTEGAFLENTFDPVATTGGNSYRSAFGDKDGDGDMDLFVANEGLNFYFQNQGGDQAGTEGAFVQQSPGVISTDSDSSRDVECADWDGDGDMDLFVANAGQNNYLYRNGGVGAFSKEAAGPVVTDGADSYGGVFLDGDRDGDLDLAVANFGGISGTNNAYYINQGGDQLGTEGVFQALGAGALVTDGGASFDVAAGDYSCDGYPDLAFSNFGSDNFVYKNVAGAFSAHSGAPTEDGGVSNAVTFGDVDMDGALDLYFANSSDGLSTVNFLYRNNGVGRFVRGASEDFTSTAGNNFDVAAGDVDGDGDVDLFSSHGNDTDNALFINQGGDQAGTEGEFTVDGLSVVSNDGGKSWGADLGDLDGDGDLDLYVANRLDDNAFYENQGGDQLGTEGDFLEITSGPLVVGTSANSRSTEFGDADGDGDLDVVVANSSNLGNYYFVNQGGAQLGAEGDFLADITTPIVTSLGDNYHATWGDADGDDDIDLFVASRNQDNMLFVNQGGSQAGTEGVFVQATVGPFSGDGGDSFWSAWGDKDMDGDLDLFVVNGAQANFLYTNDGNLQAGVEGEFTKVTDGPVVNTNLICRYGAWSDTDVDGDQDLFVGNAGSDDNELYCNQTETPNGAGEAGLLVPNGTGWIVSEAQDARGGIFADIDSDGDEDLMIGHFAQDNSIFVNQTDPVIDGPWTDLGLGKVGVNGIPVMNGTGTLDAGTPVGLQVVDGAPSSTFTLIVGIFNISANFKGGTLVPSPDVVLGGLPLNGAGFFSLVSNWPGGVPPGTSIYFQAWIIDGAATQGLSATNGLEGTTP